MKLTLSASAAFWSASLRAGSSSSPSYIDSKMLVSRRSSCSSECVKTCPFSKNRGRSCPVPSRLLPIVRDITDAAQGADGTIMRRQVAPAHARASTKALFAMGTYHLGCVGSQEGHWQLDHSHQQSIERDRSLECVAAASLLHDCCESKRLCQQRTQHRAHIRHCGTVEATPRSGRCDPDIIGAPCQGRPAPPKDRRSGARCAA
jgi:hypothetical protein